MLTLVYGYGVSGKSAVNLLLKLERQVAVFADEQVEVQKGVINRSGMSIDDALEDVGLVCISPSVELDCELLKEARLRNIEIISELELGYRNTQGDIIAITGTNGKTTCTELITAMLKNAQINADYYGNIGVPFAENSLDITQDKVAVLEVSSFQLATIELFCPKIAICLNISDDHLEYHKSIQNYIKCKLNIFKNQDKNEYAVVNFDDEILKSATKDIKSDIYYFSLNSKVKGSYLQGKSIYFFSQKEEYICDIDDINIKGEHNVANCLACITACKILNMPNNVIVGTLKQFELSSHRVQLVRTLNGVKYFDDSKSTNISSTISACKAMIGKTVLLVGGYDKGLDYHKMFAELPIKVTTVICFGDNKDKIIQDAEKSYCTSVIRAESLEDAIEISHKIKCDNVLFSPATSSFDRFANYAERGNFFKEYVMGFKNWLNLRKLM